MAKLIDELMINRHFALVLSEIMYSRLLYITSVSKEIAFVSIKFFA